MLIEDQPNLTSEGFSRLQRINFSEQRAARCKIDIPDAIRGEILSYLTGIKDKNVYGGWPAKTKKQTKEENKKGAKKAYGNIVKYTEDFFGSSASQLLSPENFREITKLANMFLFDDVPYVYCQALNRLLEVLTKVVLAWRNQKDDASDDKTAELSLDANDMSLIYLHEEYARLVILPKIYRSATDFTSKVNSLNIKFFQGPEGRLMKFAMLHFKEFIKEFLLNDTFSVDKLKEDIQNFDDDFRMLRSIDDFSTESAYEDFASQLERNKSIMQSAYDEKLNIFSEFDRNNENDDASGKQAKSLFCGEWIDYLITTIEKIFYDNNFIINIPTDCKNELSRFVGYLKAEKQNY